MKTDLVNSFHQQDYDLIFPAGLAVAPDEEMDNMSDDALFSDLDPEAMADVKYAESEEDKRERALSDARYQQLLEDLVSGKVDMKGNGV